MTRRFKLSGMQKISEISFTISSLGRSKLNGGDIVSVNMHSGSTPTEGRFGGSKYSSGKRTLYKLYAACLRTRPLKISSSTEEHFQS